MDEKLEEKVERVLLDSKEGWNVNARRVDGKRVVSYNNADYALTIIYKGDYRSQEPYVLKTLNDYKK